MRVEIDDSLVNDENAYVWLNRILHKIADGWHVWDTSNLTRLPEAAEGS